MENDHVQIHAKKDEMMGRIRAFCSRKKEQTNEANVKTFCGVRVAQVENSPDYNSCARVDAVYFPTYKGSRFPVSSVDNKEGPQLDPVQEDQLSSADLTTGANIVDRVCEIEQHCNIPGRTDISLIERVKKLEERILYLEGTSLEYFNRPKLSNSNIHDTEAVDSNTEEMLYSSTDKSTSGELSIAQIDERIQELKHKLRVKALELG